MTTPNLANYFTAMLTAGVQKPKTDSDFKLSVVALEETDNANFAIDNITPHNIDFTHTPTGQRYWLERDTDMSLVAISLYHDHPKGVLFVTNSLRASTPQARQHLITLFDNMTQTAAKE